MDRPSLVERIEAAIRAEIERQDNEGIAGHPHDAPNIFRDDEDEIIGIDGLLNIRALAEAIAGELAPDPS